MANYPGMSPHFFMPCGTWQANPWDTNPPLGCQPNLVWPQNPTPYQVQQGNPTGWSYNNNSLYPHHLMPGYQNQHQQHCPPHGKPPTAQPYQPNYRSQLKPNHNPDESESSSQSRNQKPAVKFGRDACVPCPCCGNMTTNNNVINYQTKIGKRRARYADSDSSSQDTVKQCASLDDGRYMFKHDNQARNMLNTQDLDLYAQSHAPHQAQLYRNNNGIQNTQHTSYNNSSSSYCTNQEQTNTSQSSTAQKRTASESKRQLVHIPSNYNQNYNNRSYGGYRNI